MQKGNEGPLFIKTDLFLASTCVYIKICFYTLYLPQKQKNSPKACFCNRELQKIQRKVA